MGGHAEGEDHASRPEWSALGVMSASPILPKERVGYSHRRAIQWLLAIDLRVVH